MGCSPKPADRPEHDLIGQDSRRGPAGLSNMQSHCRAFAAGNWQACGLSATPGLLLAPSLLLLRGQAKQPVSSRTQGQGTASHLPARAADSSADATARLVASAPACAADLVASAAPCGEWHSSRRKLFRSSSVNGGGKWQPERGRWGLARSLPKRWPLLVFRHPPHLL